MLWKYSHKIKKLYGLSLCLIQKKVYHFCLKSNVPSIMYKLDYNILQNLSKFERCNKTKLKEHVRLVKIVGWK